MGKRKDRRGEKSFSTPQRKKKIKIKNKSIVFKSIRVLF